MNTFIIGLGLMGGSVALDLKKISPSHIITGFDLNRDNEKKALSLGLVDKLVLLNQGLSEADFILIAVPVDAILESLSQYLDHLKPTAVITDVGSTKQSICTLVSKHKNRPRFVAAHPMAGTENSGPEAALLGLFKDKTVVICDREKSSIESLQRVESLYQSLQAKIIFMTAEEHDLRVAYVSHLSHISSFVLANTVLAQEKDNSSVFDLAGGGFESTVRLAKSSPAMWSPIFVQNKNHISEALASYIEHLQEFKQAIDDGAFNKTFLLMKKANEIRRILSRMDKK